jgi:rare lipoprotein A
MKRIFVRAAAGLALSACVAMPSVAQAQCGSASWYSLPGNRTANGERMNPSAMTAAHRSLPFGTKVTVTNNRNGRSVVVRINDRGPFIKGRIIDVSKAAAHALGFVSAGHAKICLDRH